MRIVIIAICLLLLTPVNAFAEKLATNVENVFVKNMFCNRNIFGKPLEFTVTNKGTTGVNNNLIITVFDEDDDPIDNDMKKIVLKPVSGDSYLSHVACSDKYNFAFRFE